MNVLYVAIKDFSNYHYGGNQKVINECRALENLGHTVTLIGRFHSDIVIIAGDGSMKTIKEYRSTRISVVNKLADKKHQFAEIRNYIKDKHFDLCYIRYDLSTRGFLNTVKALRNCCDRIVIEVATYPYEKEYAHTKFSGIRLLLDRKYGKKLKKYVDYVASFYDMGESGFFGIPVIYVPNGFDFSNRKVITDPIVPKDIDIIAVSSMREWHGYERFIEGMYQYYSTGGNRNIVLHLVGNGPECAKYKALTEKYALQNRVLFYGSMHGEPLIQLLESCTLGIDSLARHRTGITVLSSLKSREYGATGIPLINSCKIDILEDDYPYCLYTTADESPIPMEDVISFYDRVYAGNNRAEVAAQIRNYIEERSDMNAVMKMIMEGVF